MKKIIAFDMDDVLVNLLDAWIELLNNKYVLNVKREDVVEWDMKKAYPTLDDYQIYSVLESEYLWMNVKPKHNGCEVIEQLIKDGYKIIVVTASSPRTIHTKLYKCLFVHYPMLNYTDVIMCNEKQLIKCDYIIDDAPFNLNGHSAIKLLMDAPYNQTCPEDIYDFRVHNLDEVYAIIKQME